MEYTLFYDTNALLNLQNKAFEENFIISQKTLEEIEHIKCSKNKDGEIKWKAANTSRLINSNVGKYDVVATNSEIKKLLTEFDVDETPDNIIIASAYYINKSVPVIVVSDDSNVKFISRCIFGLLTKGTNELNLVDNEEYIGYKEITMSDEEMNYFYNHINDNIYDLLINEYLIIYNKDGEWVDNRRWDGETHKTLNYKQINNTFIGKIKPINTCQMLAFDMLQNKDITVKVLSGRWGSGKSLLSLSNSLNLIQQGKYDKIVFLRNAIHISGVEEVGYIPGSLEEKYSGFTAAIADHLGGEQGLSYLETQGSISIEHIGEIRGRTYDNSIVYVAEAENLTKDHVQLLISRIGENSILILDGDYKQVDSPIFRLNNGLMSAIDRLKGHSKFGFIKLNKTERSATAEMAELLD